MVGGGQAFPFLGVLQVGEGLGVVVEGLLMHVLKREDVADVQMRLCQDRTVLGDLEDLVQVTQGFEAVAYG